MRKLLLIALCLLFATSANAITGLSLGVKGGVVWAYDHPALELLDIDKLNLAGAQIRITTLPVLDFIISGEYAWKTKDVNISGTDYELKMHDLALSASAVYPVKLLFVTPYAGAGLSTHIMSFDVPGGASLDIESNTKTGYHLVGGANIGIPLFPIDFTAEFRMNWVKATEGTVNYKSFTVGANLKLP